MTKKALIFDLDNTIYSVPSIGHEMFASLFKLIEGTDSHLKDMADIKKEIMRRPFQVVAADYNFSDELTKRGIDLLQHLKYEGKIEVFPDYHELRNLTLDRYLVTTGFLKLQQSKISGMKIEKDFKEIFIIDPSIAETTKKDVFASIVRNYHYKKAEVLVIGDDLHAEIQAARDLGIDAVLYDKFNLHRDTGSMPKITSFSELKTMLGLV